MNSIIWVIIYPLLTAFSLLVIDHFFKRLYQGVVIISGIILFLLGGNLLLESFAQARAYSLGSWAVTKGINLVLDPLAGILVFLTTGLALLIIIYSLKYIKANKIKYYTLFFILIAALNGLFLTGDLFNMFVCLEIVSIASYALVAFKQNNKAYEASFKYIIIGSLGGFFILLAIILIYQQTGTLNLAQLVKHAQTMPEIIDKAIIMLLLVGFGSKFALFPLHTWLPDAHPAAPASISALLSGIVIKGYLYAWLRTLLVLDGPGQIISSNFNLIILYSGVATLIVGHLLAYQQKSLKRLLAYSSISQIGYIMIGLGTFKEQGFNGAFLHIINHAVVKSALFLCAGIFSQKLKAKKIAELQGVGYKKPYLGLFFTLGAVTIIGLPPFNIFISKWLIASAALKAKFVIPGATILLGSILALSYYLKVIKALYSKDNIKVQSLKGNWQFQVPIALLTVSCLIIGLQPNFILVKLQEAVTYLLQTDKYYQILFTG